MKLEAGTKLGRYEIRSKIGEGGMGEVYLGRDEKLNRDVAIKVLLVEFSQNADRLRRFEQEAQAASALSHPNILSVYDFGEHDGAPYVVSELLEGETLRARLKSAVVPQSKAIDYATQIGRGLAAAHARGIIHRDLKPENIFITSDGRVKILDFGLAKLLAVSVDNQILTDAPTRRIDTDPGNVMGTAAYMSPEQARGLATDQRADIFAFGAVLYEMLSGKSAFQRGSNADTISAILNEDPPQLSTTNSHVAPALEHIIRRCLEKNPEERFQSARDFAFALEALGNTTRSSSMLAESPKIGRRITREHIAWLLVIILFLTTLALIVPYFRSVPAVKSAASFLIYPPEKTLFNADDVLYSTALSPDGRVLAFVILSEGRTQIWLRALDKVVAEPLANTEGARNPFWSPDGRYLAFFAGGKLKKIAATGGVTTTLCDARLRSNSGTWSRDGVILFTVSDGEDGIQRVSADGGDVTQVTKLDATRGDIYHFWPHFLPDGRHFFFLVRAARRDESAIYIGTLDTGETRRLVQANSRAIYAPPGYLLYVREGALVAQPFDASALRFTGDAMTIAEHVNNFKPTGNAQFSVSMDGEVLVYQAGSNVSRLAWVERSGTEIGSVGAPADYQAPRISPDGQKLAVDIADARDGTNDIWIFDLARGTSIRFTFEPEMENAPVWSPDGERIVYSHDTDGPPHLFQKSLNDSGGSGEMLTSMNRMPQRPSDWSTSGQFVIYRQSDPRTAQDLMLLPIMGERKPSVFMSTPFNEYAARFSPDGHWVAYASDESGRAEVYVRSFNVAGERLQVSNAGGSAPCWRRDGQELFYISADGNLMAAAVKTGEKFQAGTIGALFRIPRGAEFDAMPDGKKFLVNSTADAPPLPLTVVTDWAAKIKR